MSAAKHLIRRTIDAAWIAEALNRADAILVAPPARAHIVRTAPVGFLVQRFALPLDLLPPTNNTRHGRVYVLAKIKERLGLLMWVQAKGGRKTPLDGRPFVRCVRFSAVEPDKYNDGFKFAIDKLCRKKNALGYLRDDRPSDCEVVQSWEYAPPRRGFGLIEVWTGASVAEPQKAKKPSKRRAGIVIRVEART
jgi:hypothetical protein